MRQIRIFRRICFFFSCLNTVSEVDSENHIKMSSRAPITSHSAPKTKTPNNSDNKKQTPKPSQTAKIYINLHKCLTGAILSKKCVSNQFSIFMH